MRNDFRTAPKEAHRHHALGTLRRQVFQRHRVSLVLQGRTDRGRSRTVIESGGAVAANRTERVGQRRIAQDLAGMRWSEPHEECASVSIAAQRVFVQREGTRDDVGGNETVARVRLRRGEQLVEIARPVRACDVLPRTHRARNGNGVGAAQGHRTVTTFAQEACFQSLGRAAAAVIGYDFASSRLVQKPECISSDPATRWIDDGENRIRCNRRVDGIAPAAQDVDPGGRRKRVRRSDHCAR